MGYADRPKVFRIVFDDPDDEQHGLEVKMRGLSTGQVLDVMDLAGLDVSAAVTVEGREQIKRLFGVLADGIVSWNLTTEDGESVAPSFDAIRGRDFTRNMALFGAWLGAMTEVAPPLGMPSFDTSTIPQESLRPTLSLPA